MVRGNFKQGGVNVIGLFLFNRVVEVFEVYRGNVNFIFTHSYFILVTSLYFVNIFFYFHLGLILNAFFDFTLRSFFFSV